MRVITLVASMCLALLSSTTNAQVKPDRAMSQTMAAPGENWFIAMTYKGAYIYDADTGDMHGLLSLADQSPAIEVNNTRQEFYAPESHYSRGVRGERTDIVTVYDFKNLSPVAEIEIPKKLAVLHFRRHVAQVGDGRFVLALNMTPAQSVSIVDVEKRKFAGEISTPGCAIMMPVGGNDFMMMCGDGTLQLISLADDGTESRRVRSKSFFKVQEDPIFDRPSPTADGWALISHEGKAFNVTVDGTKINIGASWSLLTDKDIEEQWRPGGQEFNTVHKETGLMYVAMHQGERYTHPQSGTEIWVMSVDSKRRIARIKLDSPVHSLYVTQSDNPKLVAINERGAIKIFDAITFREERTIEDAGPGADFIQGF